MNAIIFVFAGRMGNDRWLRVAMGYNNPLIVLTAIGVFIGFVRLTIFGDKINRIIFFFSKSTLAVYLLHSTNKVFTVFRSIPIQYIKNNFGIKIAYLSLLLFAVLIYVACTLFDTAFRNLTKINEISDKFGKYITKEKRGIIK